MAINSGVTQMLVRGQQFLFLVRRPPCFVFRNHMIVIMNWLIPMEYQSLSNDFHNCLIIDCLTLSWKYFMHTQEYVEIRTMWDN